MKKAFLRKSIALAVLLLVLAFSTTTINSPLVKADAGGIGKFLTIEIVGEGSVAATKAKSGEIWDFPPSVTEKVGAGTVLLEAKGTEGWEFSHWEGDLTGTSVNPTEYKTEKYGDVIAVFVKRTYTITASAVGCGVIDPAGEVSVEHGANQTFEFTPDEGKHISAILVDGIYRNFAESYTFINVAEGHTITVFFSAIGTATVLGGTDVIVFLDSRASLTFDQVTSEGTASGEIPDFPAASSAAVWDIQTTASFADVVLVALPYDETEVSNENNLRLFRGDSIDALYSDVNGDGIVDGTDVSIVANAIKTTTPKERIYDPLLDVNRDGTLDEADIHTINENKGQLSQDITYEVDTVNNIIYGITDQFSVFRAR